MEGTRTSTPTLVVTDRYGRQTEGTLTRSEWLERDDDDTVTVVRCHRDLLGEAA
jgi:hypothetical protein